MTKYGGFQLPHILFGRVTAVDPFFNMVKIRLRPPYNSLPDQWARILQFNSGSLMTPTAQSKNKITNEQRTGFWILPRVNDYVICAYIDGTPIEPNLVCLGAILAPGEEKSIEAMRFNDWVMHHSTETFFRIRGLDEVEKIKNNDSKSTETEFSFSKEFSRAEVEINNRDGSIFRITEFSEGEILSDDEIYLRDNGVQKLIQGRRKRNVDNDDTDKDKLELGRGMIQFLHNTGGYLTFRNLEASTTEDKRLEINLFHKNNFLKFSEETLDKPTISLTQSTSSFMEFDEDGNIQIDTSLSDKTITIITKNNTSIVIEDGVVTINSDNVTVNSKNATVSATTKAIVESPKIELGSGATEAVMKGDLFKTFYGTIKSIFTSHSHPTGVGPSGPPTSQFPTFDDGILSTVVTTK